MSHISFALLQATESGASIGDIATRLQLPELWVQERIEAARLCLLVADSVHGETDEHTRLLLQCVEWSQRQS